MPVSLEELVPGTNVVVYWEANPRNPESVKSNKISLGKTSKIILVSKEYQGSMPRPGEVWVCRIDRSSSKTQNKGAIFVRPIQRHVEYVFEGVYVDPIKAKLMACVLQDPRRNLMLEGDQGVGKSTIAGAIAKTLNWEYRKISCGLIKKAVFMLGRFIPKGEGTTLMFEWADSKLTDVLREANKNPRKTFLLMFDEFTRMDEDARDVLLDVIEGSQRVLRLVTGEEIPIPPNVVFMAAGNVGEGFTIRREDAAAKDRWEVIKITVMPIEHELAHCMRLYPSAPKKEMHQALEAINAVRAARRIPDMRLSKNVSTRRAEAVAMYLSNGFPLEQALTAAVVNQYEGSVEDSTSQAARVQEVITKKLAELAKETA